MTKFEIIIRFIGVGPARNWFKLLITTRASWTENNAMPDSIIMNITCWSLGPPVEINEPNFRSPEVALTTLRILNTIKHVTRAFTTMDVT